MYTFLLACAIVFCLILLALAAFEVIADRWADYTNRARDAISAPEALRDVPEPTWDRRHDPRDRLRHVEPRRPVRIPVQRDGSGH